MSTSAAAAPRRAVEILLVEDNRVDVRLAQEALREAQVENSLHVATDGEEALDYLHRRGRYKEARRPDLVLLDLNLPRKDGREVLADIKADDELRRIPVIVMTTSSDEDDVKRSYDLHVNCYVTKPVDLDQFLGIMRSINDFWLSVATLPEA